MYGFDNVLIIIPTQLSCYLNANSYRLSLNNWKWNKLVKIQTEL